MKNEQLSFEEALSELQKIVLDLEKGELTLDHSLEIFKRGVELSKFCNALLDASEKKISILIEKENGDLEEQVLSQKEDSNGF